jgi:DNA-binding response OmpR family regulator
MEGAIDYLVAPLDRVEFEARARARLEFPIPIAFRPKPGERFSQWADAIGLNLRERRLCRLLFQSLDGSITREAMSYSLWGNIKPGSRRLDMAVAELRRKLSSNDRTASAVIESVRNFGYRLTYQPVHNL